MQIKIKERSILEGSGAIFLEAVFLQIPREIYTDMGYLKQSGTEMRNDFNKETQEYFKEILTRIWYDKRDFEQFDTKSRERLTTNTYRREMYGIFIRAARDIAEKRDKSSDNFFAEFCNNLPVFSNQ